jgi:hypothetical protein
MQTNYLLYYKMQNVVVGQSSLQNTVNLFRLVMVIYNMVEIGWGLQGDPLHSVRNVTS